MYVWMYVCGVYMRRYKQRPRQLELLLLQKLFRSGCLSYYCTSYYDMNKCMYTCRYQCDNYYECMLLQKPVAAKADSVSLDTSFIRSFLARESYWKRIQRIKCVQNFVYVCMYVLTQQSKAPALPLPPSAITVSQIHFLSYLQIWIQKYLTA